MGMGVRERREALARSAWQPAAVIGCVAVLLIASGLRSVAACDIDGLPSLTVDHTLVLVNSEQPTSPATLKVWAPFVPPFSLIATRTYTFAEIRQRIPLTPEAFENSWRWAFGDGTPPARGDSVRHVYRRPGVYRVTVAAYFPSHKIWYTFDALQVRVTVG